jgi:hypothetical protein
LICPCSQRKTEEASFEGMQDFQLERDTLFDILADSRVVKQGLSRAQHFTLRARMHAPSPAMTEFFAPSAALAVQDGG